MRLLEGHYFAVVPELGPILAAAMFLEGLALFVIVAAIIGSSRARLTRLISMAVAGAAGAAALNVSRLVTAAVATGDGWGAVIRLARTTRINMEYADVNAAGSYFAMLLCLAVGLTLMTTRRARIAGGRRRAGDRGRTVVDEFARCDRRRPGGGRAVSHRDVRTQRGLGTPTGRSRRRAGGPIRAHRRRSGSRHRGALFGIAGLTVATLIVVLFLPNRLIGGNATAAAEIRRDMAVVSWRLLARNPAFGVGIGQSYELSGDEMLRLPVGRIYIRQNAHNNFLQILAELGVVGLVCFGACYGCRAGDSGSPAALRIRQPSRPARLPRRSARQATKPTTPNSARILQEVVVRVLRSVIRATGRCRVSSPESS